MLQSTTICVCVCVFYIKNTAGHLTGSFAGSASVHNTLMEHTASCVLACMCSLLCKKYFQGRFLLITSWDGGVSHKQENFPQLKAAFA